MVTFLDMDQRAVPGEENDDSKSESLSDFVGYSDAESLVESVGSVEIESFRPKSKRNESKDSTSSSREMARKSSRVGTHYMHFVKEMRDVPAHEAWEFIRNHRAMASLVPGITEKFNYLEGQGDTGSVYVAVYSPKCVRPGEDNYVINKVEFSDDVSKLYVVRSMGGKYQRRYELYMTYIKVMANEVLGESSSVVAWSLEYQLRNPESPAPLDTKEAYLTVMDLIRDRYHTINRVERPLVSLTVVKRLRLPAGQQQLTIQADEQEPAEGPSQRRRRLSRVKNEEGSDRESKKKLSPQRKGSNIYQASGSGLLFRRRPPIVS